MHFSKTYQQLLLTLPGELRDSAIEYRKLKKLINQVVTELTSLGLSPQVLHEVLQTGESNLSAPGTVKVNDQEFKVVYELSNDSDCIEPRLRLWIEPKDSKDGFRFTSSIPILNSERPAAAAESSSGPVVELDSADNDVHNVERFTSSVTAPVSLRSCELSHAEPVHPDMNAHEVIIPLVSDMAFFQLLTQALQMLTARLMGMRHNFESNIHALSRSISLSARPMSSTSYFNPYSPHTTNAAAITVQTPSSAYFSTAKSDLYAWREIFQLYIDAEVFESRHENFRGERTIEDAEERLSGFLQRLNERGVVGGHELKLKESRQALQTLIQLNMFILDLRKFQHATTEATRKILKKHVKRTALPHTPVLPSPFVIQNDASTPSSLSLSLPTQLFGSFNTLAPSSGTSLSLLLGQAIGESILPIIPHIDDYACLICTSIAFKPIRLRCGHLFCVRCLVKMQKRGQGDCPMCRAPTVLSADRSNVDWALLNFMKDWFPIESRKKLRQNEREVAEEEIEELGLNPGSCIIM